jgi:hypothetical protein
MDFMCADSTDIAVGEIGDKIVERRRLELRVCVAEDKDLPPRAFDAGN